jgi:hypothetical protein
MLMDFYDKAFNMCLFCMYFAHVLWQKNCCHQRNKWLLTHLVTLIELVFQMKMRLCRPEAILTFPVSLSLQFFLKVMRLTLMPTNHELINKN